MRYLTFYPLIFIFTILLSFFHSASLQAAPLDSPITTLNNHLTANKGKVIYIDFWASWCGPCRKSFPWMNNLHQQYKDEGLVIISINVDNDHSYAEQFLKEIPALFPVIFDPKGRIARQYKIKGMPSSFVIDRAGKITSSHVGFNDTKKIAYQAEIMELLRAEIK